VGGAQQEPCPPRSTPNTVELLFSTQHILQFAAQQGINSPIFCHVRFAEKPWLKVLFADLL